MKYLSVALCGNGFGAMDNFWERYHGSACRPFLVWEDMGGWYVYSGSPDHLHLSSAPTTDYHVYEWRFVNGSYELQIDGVTAMADGCAPRATSIFFGHPHPIACAPWTSFEVDYIHIEPMGATTTAAPTWAAIKARWLTR